MVGIRENGEYGRDISGSWNRRLVARIHRDVTLLANRNCCDTPAVPTYGQWRYYCWLFCISLSSIPPPSRAPTFQFPPPTRRIYFNLDFTCHRRVLTRGRASVTQSRTQYGDSARANRRCQNFKSGDISSFSLSIYLFLSSLYVSLILAVTTLVSLFVCGSFPSAVFPPRSSSQLTSSFSLYCLSAYILLSATEECRWRSKSIVYTLLASQRRQRRRRRRRRRARLSSVQSHLLSFHNFILFFHFYPYSTPSSSTLNVCI